MGEKLLPLPVKAEAAARAAAVLTAAGSVIAAMKNLPVNAWMPIAIGFLVISAGARAIAGSIRH